MPVETETPAAPPAAPAITVQDVLAVLVGGLAIVYLLNPTLGVFELIPDNTPFLGNLDEAAATVLLLAALGHFGIRIPGTSSPKAADPAGDDSP